MDQLKKSVLVAVAFVLAGANAAATCLLTADDIKSYAEESMTFFPPSETSATLSSQGVQMDVVLGVVDVQVLSIEPATNSFSASYRTDMYWNKESCTNTNLLMTACANRVGTWYFLEAPNALGESTTMASLSFPASDTAGVLLDFGNDCTSGDFLSVQTTFSHDFDMSYYPFEQHTLTITLRSMLTYQSLNIKVLGGGPETQLPSAWTMDRPMLCLAGSKVMTETARGNTAMQYPLIECKATASKIDTSWVLNSYLLFLTVVLMNGFLSLGVTVQPLSYITGATADPLELPLQLAQRAGITAGIVLAYIFAIEYKPYGMSLQHFKYTNGPYGMPLSALIYFFGLFALMVTGLWSAILAYAALVMVRRPSKRRVAPKEPASEESGAAASEKGDEVEAAMRKRAVAIGARLAVLDWWVIVLVHGTVVLVSLVLMIHAASTYKEES